MHANPAVIALIVQVSLHWQKIFRSTERDCGACANIFSEFLTGQTEAVTQNRGEAVTDLWLRASELAQKAA